MNTNDERVTFPFDSEPSGAVRFRIKPSRPGSRKLAAAALHSDKPTDISAHSGHLFPPQSSATPFAADAIKAAGSRAGGASEILPNALPKYLFIVVCICIVAAAFGASAGYYIVSFSSPSPMFQNPARSSRIDSVPQQEPSASEKMALKISEMRKIAAEEAEGTDTLVEDAKPNSAPMLPGSSLAHPKDGSAGALALPATSPVQHCSAGSQALALCGEK